MVTQPLWLDESDESVIHLMTLIPDGEIKKVKPPFATQSEPSRDFTH